MKGFENRSTDVYCTREKHPDNIFLAPDREVHILPPKYLDELKSQPVSIASLTHAVMDYFLSQYTGLDASLSSSATWNILHGRLGRQVYDLIDDLDSECQFALGQEFLQTKEWTRVVLYPTMQRIVARMNGRVYVGPSLCRNEDWLFASIDYSTCVFVGVGYLKAIPSFLRPLVAPLVPYIRRIHQHHRTGHRLFASELAHRRELVKEKSSPGNLRDDMIQWLLNDPAKKDCDVKRMVVLQLLTAFASIDGTTNHLTNVLSDLAARWDKYAPILRQEIEEMVQEDGGGVTKQAVQKLSKMDSFMKESQRLNPLGALSFKRKMLAPLTLSDGAIIGMASAAMACSPWYHSEPEIFDGLRFHRMRVEHSSSTSASFLFTTTGPGSLMFGHGKYAYPGRFFASLESKVVLVHIIREYDLRVIPGGTRPPNLLLGDANISDYTAAFEMRRRV